MIPDRDSKTLIPDKKNLKNFCLTMGIVFGIFTFIILVRHRHSSVPTSIVSLVFFISFFTTPAFLKPVYVVWMKLAFILSWINTRLILIIIFYLIFTPVGLAMRLLRKDLLDRKIEKSKESYWLKIGKKTFNPDGYQRQF